MTRSLAVFLLAAVSLSTRAAGADRFSRADVMKRAARHPATEAANSQTDQARAEKRQADSLRWPRISLTLGVIPSLRATLVEARKRTRSSGPRAIRSATSSPPSRVI
jgi:hypothetical protein